MLDIFEWYGFESDVRRKRERLELIMKEITSESLSGTYCMEYQSFPGALLRDIESVWRSAGRGNGIMDTYAAGVAEARKYKCQHEGECIGKERIKGVWGHKTQGNSYTAITREEAYCLLRGFLDNWKAHEDKLCICLADEACICFSERRTEYVDKIVDFLFERKCKNEPEKIRLIENPGIQPGYALNSCAEYGFTFILPVDTKQAHIWRRAHFLKTFTFLEDFIRNNKSNARLLYVLRPNSDDAERETGEALYRVALERAARNCIEKGQSIDEIDATVRLLVPVDERAHYRLQGLFPENIETEASSGVNIKKILNDGAFYLSDSIVGLGNKKGIRSEPTTAHMSFVDSRKEMVTEEDIIHGISIITKENKLKHDEVSRAETIAYPIYLTKKLVNGFDAKILNIYNALNGNGEQEIEGWRFMGLVDFLELPAQRTRQLAETVK